GIELVAFFLFQAEDGIRDATVTGVQTCALPILRRTDSRAALIADSTGRQPQPTHESVRRPAPPPPSAPRTPQEDRGANGLLPREIGRASCRERAVGVGDDGIVKIASRRSTK